MGPEVYALEEELAEYCGAEHVISAASGDRRPADVPDELPHRPRRRGGRAAVHVRGHRRGDPAPGRNDDICRRGGVYLQPRCEPAGGNRTACPAAGQAQHSGYRARWTLFGLPADYAAINEVAASHDLFVLADAAQSFGGARDGRRVGTFGDLAATSFFPSKPLGCYGDGGAVFTGDGERAEVLRSIRFPWQGCQPVRQHPHRHHRTAGHPPGGGAAMQAQGAGR